MELKKLYYYVICLISFFILLWGAVDLTSSALGLATLRKDSISSVDSERSMVADKNDQMFDSFYQSRMLQDRVLDSLARIIIAGIVFGYARKTVAKLEEQA